MPKIVEILPEEKKLSEEEIKDIEEVLSESLRGYPPGIYYFLAYVPKGKHYWFVLGPLASKKVAITRYEQLIRFNSDKIEEAAVLGVKKFARGKAVWINSGLYE